MLQRHCPSQPVEFQRTLYDHVKKRLQAANFNNKIWLWELQPQYTLNLRALNATSQMEIMKAMNDIISIVAEICGYNDSSDRAKEAG